MSFSRLVYSTVNMSQEVEKRKRKRSHAEHGDERPKKQKKVQIEEQNIKVQVVEDIGEWMPVVGMKYTEVCCTQSELANDLLHSDNSRSSIARRDSLQDLQSRAPNR